MISIAEGYFEIDSNFIYVYDDCGMYTIARNSHQGAYLKIGDRVANGFIYTKEIHARFVKSCADNYGIFKYIEGGNK